MRARVLFFLVLWASTQPLSTFQAGAKERSPNEADVGRGAVERVLRTQEDAWNRHDLEAFMAGYWNSPELTFFSAASEHQGWQTTLGRYRTAYAGPGHEMGQLKFSGTPLELLCMSAA